MLNTLLLVNLDGLLRFRNRSALLNLEHDMEVVGTATDGAVALELKSYELIRL